MTAPTRRLEPSSAFSQGFFDTLGPCWGSPPPSTAKRQSGAASIHRAARTAAEHKALTRLYSKIRDANFSHEVLAARPQDLAVMRVGDVGWSDLGEPARVLATLAQLGVQSQLAISAS